MSISSGMIRLPKATKTPPKSKVVPRQSLATIVKDLGENASRDIPPPQGVSKAHCTSVDEYTSTFFMISPVVVFAAISAPLKLKASRGPPTPINRNQASQPRGSQSMLGKRSFDTVSSRGIRSFFFFLFVFRRDI